VRTLDEIIEDARPKATFLNSKQYEVFAARQCAICLVDTDTCPLIDAAFMGFWPTEWNAQVRQKDVPAYSPIARCTARVPIPKAK